MMTTNQDPKSVESKMDFQGETGAAVGKVEGNQFVYNIEYCYGIPSAQSKGEATNSSDVQHKRLAFAITGSLDATGIDRAKFEVIVAQLRKISGDTSIEIISVDDGSIKITLEGSEEGLQKIQELFESGDLNPVEGIPVEYVRPTTEEEEQELEAKLSLIERIRNRGERDLSFSGANLSGTNLSGTDLSGANLSEANLSWTNLNGADLSRADFRGANLIGANLSGANLNGADLSRADFRGACFSRANLNRANFRGACFSRANLSRANLRGADLGEADLRGADFREADFSKTIAESIRFGKRRVTHLVARRAATLDLRLANLSEANLRGADLREANLWGADLSEASVRSAYFNNNQGIDDNLRDELVARGAIFEDAPVDRSHISVRSPSP